MQANQATKKNPIQVEFADPLKVKSDPLLTEAQAAEKIIAEKATLTKWRARGRGPAYLKLSGKIRYLLSDLEAFIKSSRVDPAEARPKRSRRKRATLK
jgi:hypothetical protein